MTKLYNILDSPNPYKIYKLANSTITTSVSGQTVTFIVNIGVGDPVNWRVYVYGQKDRQLGVGGSDPNYPYFVEQITGTNNLTFTRFEIPDNYVAILALLGVGEVDFSYFGVATCQPPGGVLKYCNNNLTRCQWNQSTCNYDCFGCATGNRCLDGDCVTQCQPPSGTSYCQPDNKTLCVWNPTTCLYDCALCSTGSCSNGNCVPIPTYRACVGGHCNEQVCPSSGCPADQCTTIGQVCSTNPCQGVPDGDYTFGCCRGGVLVTCPPPPPPPPGGGCTGCDLATNMCLPGLGCQPKIYVYGAVVAVFALMMLGK